MPPASFPAFAAMRPGPAIARYARKGMRRGSRTRRARRGGVSTASTFASWRVSISATSLMAGSLLQQPREAETAAFGHERVDHVVGEDPPDRSLVVVDDEERRPPVLDETARD